MAKEKLEAQDQSAKQHSPDAIRVLDDLGGYICKATALLRAAVNTGSDEQEDHGWLVDAALTEMEGGKRRYRELCGVEPETRR